MRVDIVKKEKIDSRVCCPLQKRTKLKGQLIPLSEREIRRVGTNVALFTEDGRKFYVVGAGEWNLALWRHIWERVQISGLLDYSQRKIYVRSLFLIDEEYAEASNNAESEERYTDAAGMDRLLDFIKRGQFSQALSA